MAGRFPGKNEKTPGAAPLDLEAYRKRVRLDEPFNPPMPAPLEARQGMAKQMVAHLQAEGLEYRAAGEPDSYGEKRRLLRALLTLRPAEPSLPEWFQAAMDGILQAEAAERGSVAASLLPRLAEGFPGSPYSAAKQCSLWRGDITRLAVDAIVNAANSRMMGCFQSFHACIDNAVHSAAGPRLREDCRAIMQMQGGEEGTGWAKVTRGYNLPAKYVLHTVGPIVERGAQPTPEQEGQLADCYRACLELASRVEGIRSVAFCCISTGVFGFPNAPAARIALETAAEWLAERHGRIEQVVFNVFAETDEEIYRRAVERG